MEASGLRIGSRRSGVSLDKLTHIESRDQSAYDSRPIPCAPPSIASCNICASSGTPRRLTVKSYREDLAALADYLSEARGGEMPGAGRDYRARSARLRGRAARGGLRQDDHRPAAGLAAEFLPLRPARGLDEDQSGQAAAQSAQGPHRCRTSSRPKTSAGCSIAPARRADGPPRPGDPGDDVLGRPARERSGGARRRRPGFRTPACSASAARGAASGSRRSAPTPRGPCAAGSRVRKLHPRSQPGPTAPVFVNKFGRRLTTRSVARMLEKYLKMTGLDNRTTPALAAAQLRHAPARPRRRHPQRAGTARATRAW